MKVLPLVSEHLSSLSNKLTINAPIITCKPPITASVKWINRDNTLVKTFSFGDERQRYEFIVGIMGYEINVCHSSTIETKKGFVRVSLPLDGQNVVSNIDKNFAAFCDSLHRDIIETYRSNDKNIVP